MKSINRLQHIKRLYVCLLLGSTIHATGEQAPIKIGPLTFGGAVRVNYVYGDYTDSAPGPDRGSDGGNVELDTYRINLDLKTDYGLIGKGEYRWYDGVNFLHTGWLGWQFSPEQTIRAGMVRVPFGPGPYGISESWFFDQHYYVGLADDTDMGIRYTYTDDDWTIDVAYYYSADPDYNGSTNKSARYSYDIIDNGSEYSHYDEAHQFNLRIIKSLPAGDLELKPGISLQAGELEADDAFASDSWAYAASAHLASSWKDFSLKTQLTYYDYNADYHQDTGLSNDLIGMGAYAFEFPVASEGILPAASLSYTLEPEISWIDSITIYEEYSIILKDGSDAEGNTLNDSALNILGVAISKGNWYTYIDWAYSDGNYFVGNESFTDFGSNPDQTWQSRFNINLGYYF